jgi:hypothetical protein
MGCCLGRRRARALLDENDEQVDLVQAQDEDGTVTKVVWQRQGVVAQNVLNVVAVFTGDCVFRGEFERETQDTLIDNIRQSIELMNGAFEDSGVLLRSSLAVIARLPTEILPPVSTDMYRDALLGAPASEQERVRRRQERTPDELAEGYGQLRNICLDLRVQHEAHVILFVTGSRNGNPVAGALGATSRDEAFVVVPDYEVPREYAPAHEIGHLFGCEHNREHVAVRQGASCYGHCTPHWRTIMAYNLDDQLPRPIIGRYSNPAVNYDDGVHGALATGTAGANNVAQINAYTDTILGFRG